MSYVICPFCGGKANEKVSGILRCLDCKKRFTAKYAREVLALSAVLKNLNVGFYNTGGEGWDGLRGCSQCGNDTTCDLCSNCRHQRMIDESEY